MAVLTDAARFEVWANTMRTDPGPWGAMTKADLLAAVNALDDFLEANAAAIHYAIPQPARGAMTVAQKARLLAYVALRRWGG